MEMMETKNNFDSRKCGDILINIKTIKNKKKVFTFHCVLCSMDCNQLKKFSKHLEKHLNYLDDKNYVDGQTKSSIQLFEPEIIKIQEQLNVDLMSKDDSNVVSGAIASEVFADPLETERNVKNENDEVNRKTGYFENISKKIEFDNCAKHQETFEIAEECKKPIKFPHTFVRDDCSTDGSTDNLREIEFDVKIESETTTNLKIFKTELAKRKSNILIRRKKAIEDTTENKTDNEVSNNNKLKRGRRVIIKTILPILIQQYKKFELLWQVNDIAFGVKNKKYEIYSKIAEEIKLQTNKSISLEDINYHIKYVNELYSKDKDRELKCKMEKRDFLPEYEHYEKMSFLSESQGPFLCTICNEILPKYDPYCQHIAQHQNTQPFKCPLCAMMFTNYHKYLIHKKRHLGIYNFHCDICGKGYLFKNDFEWHITSHTGDKPYLCQICGTGFRARHGYDNHIRRHEERFRYECHICKRGFNQLHALNNHVKSHLNIRDVICKICGKGFVHTKYLKRHELIHGKEKRYKCNECGKTFFQACGLRAHRKNHNLNMLLK